MKSVYSAYERLRFDPASSGVMRVSLTSPIKANVIDARLHEELSCVWRDIDRDPDVRAVLLTAEGPIFSAGGDLNHQVRVMDDRDLQLKLMAETQNLVRGMVDCSKPIVSAVRGWAVGAGLACALLADIAVVAKDARLADGHVKIGLAAGDHAILLWPLLCGMARAKYLLLLGESVDGAEAERIGLVAKAVEEAELDEVAMRLATRLAESSATAVRWTKHALNHWIRQAGPSFELSLALEVIGMGGADAREGVEAFLQKRPARFV